MRPARGKRHSVRRWFAIAVAFAASLCALTASAQSCFEENECTFEKPNVLVVMDYSSSMVQENFGSVTRWEAQLAAVRDLAASRSFTGDMHIGLARFGHDPEDASGTTISGDTSQPRLRDGFAVDIPFDDAAGNWTDCNADGLRSTLDALPPPPDGNVLVGTWTRGALDAALRLVQRTRARHPEDAKRLYEVVLMTDGDWNCKDSFDQADCDGDAGERDDRPFPAAARLLAAGVRVHVVAFGDGTTSSDLDAMAEAGGTVAALDAASPSEITAALNGVLTEVRNSVVVPECIGGLPRVMIIMDASTSMIVGSAPGESHWDKARYALAGNPDAPDPGDPGYVKPIFDRTVKAGGHTVTVEDVVHIGLFAYNARDTQQLMLQYAPCARDNVEWAMDPYTSCVAPGCRDPYTDPDDQLDFTSLVSDESRNPPFVQTTTSFMPPCSGGGPGRCAGLVYTTYTGEGVAAARVNLARYMADSGAFALDPDSPFVNILVTDGETSPDEVLDPEPVLADLRASGVPTYVIGFGAPDDLDVDELNSYAAAGGTGTAFVVDPAAGDSADALAARIASIIGGLDIDPCCQLNDCSQQPEPPLPFCGNRQLDEGEACDEGPRNGALGGDCAPSCARTEYCGDGEVTGAETCDDANANDRDRCTRQCLPPGVSGTGGRGNAGGAGSGSGAAPGSGASGSGASSGRGGADGAGATGAGDASGSGASGNDGSGGRSGSGASGSGASGSGDAGSSSGLYDGGVGPDGGVDGTNGSGGSVEPTGCGCRTTRSRNDLGAVAFVAFCALALRARRRAVTFSRPIG